MPRVSSSSSDPYQHAMAVHSTKPDLDVDTPVSNREKLQRRRGSAVGDEEGRLSV